MTLDDLFIELPLQLEEALVLDETKIELVHGFHSGQVLKNYLNSCQFEHDMTRNRILITRIRGESTEGSTMIQIDFYKHKKPSKKEK
jgi:hypothetical protein